jgi:hypothetical protein
MEPVDVLSTLRVKREMMQPGFIPVMAPASAPGLCGGKAQRCTGEGIGWRENQFLRSAVGEFVAQIAHNRLVEGPGTSQVADREIHVMD